MDGSETSSSREHEHSHEWDTETPVKGDICALCGAKHLYGGMTRGEMVNLLIDDEVQSWVDDHGEAVAFIEELLKGEATIKPYPQWSDDEIVAEYKDLYDEEETPCHNCGVLIDKWTTVCANCDAEVPQAAEREEC